MPSCVPHKTRLADPNCFASDDNDHCRIGVFVLGSLLLFARDVATDIRLAVVALGGQVSFRAPTGTRLQIRDCTRGRVLRRNRNIALNQDVFCVRHRWVLGLVTGIVVAAIYLIVMFMDPARESILLPGTLTAWISTAAVPVADEMLFRCILAVQIYAISQSLDGAQGWDSFIAAVILSAAVYGAFLLPEWLITDAFALDLVVKLAIEFGLGCVLTILFLTTRSIWASLIPHWAYVLFWQLAGTS